MNEIEQGTPEWLNLRKGKITASKIPVILGLSPYQTPRQLWEEELGFSPPKQAAQHMKDGLAAEEAARLYFKNATGISVSPHVVFHPWNPKFMASLDGISADGKCLLEIKKNNIGYHEMARRGQVVEFHRAQMQWQMYCAGPDVHNCHYLSYRKGDEVIVVVSRDDTFISQAVAAANRFLQLVEDLEEPELVDSDYEDVSKNHELQRYADKLREAQRLAKYYTDLAESFKKEIIHGSNDRNVRGNDWKLTKYSRKGNIDFEKMCDELQISVDSKEAYRKEAKNSYRITLN